MRPDRSPDFADTNLKCSCCSPGWTKVFVSASLPRCRLVTNVILPLSRLFCKVRWRTEKTGIPIRKRQENRFISFSCYDYSRVDVVAYSCSSLNASLVFRGKDHPPRNAGSAVVYWLLESRFSQDCPGCWPGVCKTGTKVTTETILWKKSDVQGNSGEETEWVIHKLKHKQNERKNEMGHVNWERAKFKNGFAVKW